MMNEMNGNTGKTYGTSPGQIENGPESTKESKDRDGNASPYSDASRASSAKETPSQSTTTNQDADQLPLSGRRRRLAFLMEMLLIFAVYLPFALLSPFYPTKVSIVKFHWFVVLDNQIFL